MSKIEFKYNLSEENTALQMAGKLRGLKPLNASKITPSLDGETLKMHIQGLNKNFFGQKPDISRETAFESLKEVFNTTLIWAKLIEEDESEIKMKIHPTTELEWIGDKDELTITMGVELV